MEDEAFVSALVVSLLGESSRPDSHPYRRSGWTSLLRVIPAAVRSAHFNGYDGLIVLADSDDSPVHADDCEPGIFARKARIPLMQEQIDSTLRHLKPRQGAAGLSVVCGLAIPAIEAWCLCATDGDVTEAAGRREARRGAGASHRADLKRRLYGNERIDGAAKALIVERHAADLAQRIDHAGKCFPIGFGPLLATILKWKSSRT